MSDKFNPEDALFMKEAAEQFELIVPKLKAYAEKGREFALSLGVPIFTESREKSAEASEALAGLLDEGYKKQMLAYDSVKGALVASGYEV